MMRRYLRLAGGVLCTLLASSPSFAADPKKGYPPSNGVTVGRSQKNDVSPPLREVPGKPLKLLPRHLQREPLTHISEPREAPDPVVQKSLAPPAMPGTALNFDGIGFPGVACNCAPPDTNGEVGATQYLQMVNEGIQVFDKTTGVSVFGPVSIETLWAGFGGACETAGDGDPVVVYDQLADRWVVSQFAGSSVPTDECVAVSTTSDATGSYYRYDFHLGSNYFDYPKLSVWPDAYYLAENVFDAGTVYLGPQPFALDRAAMLVGNPASFITPGLRSISLGFMLSADLDGSNPPPAGAPNPWLSTEGATWALYRFHVDWITPANSTFTLGGNLSPAGFTSLCPATVSCVPQAGTTAGLDGIGDRPMFRLAYRRFGDGHEALVGNLSVDSSGVAGIRWWEIDHATSGAPSFVQESTYSPDATWRWMGSLAMDTQGNLALGFSASSATIHPQIRYAGRLSGDPAGTLAQGESTLIAGGGSQTDTLNSRWGDYSDLTVDPVDDCTFWYTQEYYSTTGSFQWRTRIGNFKFPLCTAGPPIPVSLQVDVHPTAAPTALGLNKVFEPGETVLVEPGYFNGSSSALLLTGTASNFRGPAGAAYTLADSTADYGSIASNTTNNCFNATADCYVMGVDNPVSRPAAHWDAKFDEALSTGGSKTWALHIGESFTDTLNSHPFYSFIETIFHNGITSGCGAGIFCPGNKVTRAEMAVFILRAEHGSGYTPPGCTGIFTDVECTPTPAFAVDFIEGLKNESITSGCGAGIFCPDDNVTRAEMAVFLLRAEHGSGYTPPGCTGIFTDVECKPTPAFAVDFIERLYNEGITSGCGAGIYCPNDPATRGQMAVFLTRTFGLLLYGP